MRSTNASDKIKMLLLCYLVDAKFHPSAGITARAPSGRPAITFKYPNVVMPSMLLTARNGCIEVRNKTDTDGALVVDIEMYVPFGSPRFTVMRFVSPMFRETEQDELDSLTYATTVTSYIDERLGRNPGEIEAAQNRVLLMFEQFYRGSQEDRQPGEPIEIMPEGLDLTTPKNHGVLH